MSQDSPRKTIETTRAWFCVRAQPKHEHIAAAHLRKLDGVEVFLPRVRFRRAAGRGMAWVTEALFPGYLFAAFDWQLSLRRVQSVTGVKGVVHFGRNWPVIPEELLADLRRAIGSTELHTIAQEFAEGDAVHIVDGTLRGLRAVVSSVMPGRQRIAVLMELLGRQTTIELKTSSLAKEGDLRTEIVGNS